VKGRKIIESSEVVAVIKSAEFEYIPASDDSFYNNKEHNEAKGKIVLNVNFGIANSRRGGRLLLHKKDEVARFLKAQRIDYGLYVDQKQLASLKNNMVVLKEVYSNRVKRQAKGEHVHPDSSEFVKVYDFEDEEVYDEVKGGYRKYVNLSVM
jgi:hypothetical protein